MTTTNTNKRQSRGANNKLAIAQQTLKNLKAELTKARKELEELDQTRQRIRSSNDRATTAEAALNEFSADFSRQLAAWAETGSGEKPVIDQKKLSKLRENAQTANHEAEVASDAVESIRPKYEALEATIRGLEGNVKGAEVEVLLAHADDIGAAYAESFSVISNQIAQLMAIDHEMEARGLTSKRIRRGTFDRKIAVPAFAVPSLSKFDWNRNGQQLRASISNEDIARASVSITNSLEL